MPMLADYIWIGGETLGTIPLIVDIVSGIAQGMTSKVRRPKDQLGLPPALPVLS